MNAWVLLSLAIFLEVCGTFFLKLSDGFEKWHFGVISILFFMSCFVALAPVMKALPVGIVYAVWAGVGIVAASLIGVWIFGDKLGAIHLVFIAMILVGTVGLKMNLQ